MAYLKTVLLSKAEEDLIHNRSLECLKDVGVRIDSESVLELLEKKGASVDYEKSNAKISEKMINEALETTPKEITLHGRNPKNNLKIPVSSYPYSVTNGTAVFVLDNDTGEYRDSTRQDMGDIAKLVDGLDGVDYLWPALSATDMPACTQTLHELWIMMQNSSKHFQGDAVHGAHNAEAQIELASLIVGGKEALKKRPIISMIVCPLAPLSFEKGAIEAQVEFARAGIPIVSLSMTIGALSAPITVAGMMLTTNAENLASIVITQAAEEGAPHIYAAESSPMNLATGNINYDAPEFGLIQCGMAQMAKRYNLPAFCGDFSGFRIGSDQRETLFEHLAPAFAAASHTDIVGGLGTIDDAKGICFKQMLVDSYTWEFCREYLKPIDITDEKLALDAIKQVGPRGNFLIHPHTLKYLRNELITWDKEKYDFLTMEKEEQKEEAGKIVKRILKDHHVKPLGEAIIQKGDDLIKAYEKKYA
ncbi:MAG: trimethylamine methyltransferase family protein [Desulfobacterales bacterium]|nr:trimethylamine methyltransferase family protein [Desulfobacterales bacterium]